MTELLFYTYDLRQVIENRERLLADEVASLNENEVLNTSQEDMVQYLTEKHRIDSINIDEASIQMDYGDAQIDVSGDFRRAIFDRSEPFYITGTRVTFYVPFTGDSKLFHCRPSTYSLNLPRATVRSNEIVFTYDLTNEQASAVGDAFERDFKNVKVHVKRVAADVETFNSSLPGNASQRMNDRRDKFLQDRDLVTNIGFPFRPRQDIPPTFVTPNIKGALPLKNRRHHRSRSAQNLLWILANTITSYPFSQTWLLQWSAVRGHSGR